MEEIYLKLKKKFIIEKCLAENEKCKVFIVRDEFLQRRTLLKRLTCSSRDDLKDLEKEVKNQIKANSKCEYTPVIYNTFLDNNFFYIEMEYIDKGVNLATYIDNIQNIDFNRNLKIFKNICRTVANLHDIDGFIHKDLKPENIIINEKKNCAYIFDFGISGPWFNKGSGTYYYMAPEQRLKNRSIRSCQATDVYSLGIIGVQLFANKLLKYNEDLVLKIRDIEWEKEPDYDSLVNNKELAKILKKCLAADPSKRYPNARALLQTLR